MMTSLKVPSMFEITTASKFFQDLIALNRGSRAFSQRLLAQKLKWPISYIPDLIKGRKVFSIQRATQIGRYLKLDPISFEKLVLLSIQDMKLLSAGEITSLNSLKSAKQKDPTIDVEMLDAKVLLVFEAVRWFNGRASQEALVDLLETRSVSNSEVSSAIILLVKKGHIKKNKSFYVAHSSPVFSDDGPEIDSSILHSQFTALQLEFFKAPYGPACFNSAYVHIDIERFDEVAEKVFALRNWILEVSALDGKKTGAEHVRLFQLDFNLTPVFRGQKVTKWRVSTK